MDQTYNKKILLEDGTEFYGYSFGADREIAAELVFNTSMTGYQEILSDPSYTGQAIVMTYPLIGNYGMCDGDYETDRPTASAMIVREYNDMPSNFRSTKTLGQVMEEFGIVGISGVDTRSLTRYIRDKGTCKALITSAAMPRDAGVSKLKETVLKRNQVSQVSPKHPRHFKAAGSRFHVVAVDCGMKQNILRCLNAKGCDVTAVPWDTDSREIEKMAPDGIFISNGPGDPQDVTSVIRLVRQLRGKYPIFGICLGHQIIALAYGAATYKLKFGHRGGNHPVQNLETGKIEITAQNHSYAVDLSSLENTGLTATHINLLDHTVEGQKCLKDHVFSVQYHPESAPGPQDSSYLFDEFISMMEEARHAKKN